VITSVVFRFLSRQQRSDQVLRIAGAMAFATAAVEGVLTVTGLLPGISAAAAGTVLASTVWLLAIGVCGARLPHQRRARVTRTARLIAATILCSGVADVRDAGDNQLGNLARFMCSFMRRPVGPP